MIIPSSCKTLLKCPAGNADLADRPALPATRSLEADSAMPDSLKELLGYILIPYIQSRQHLQLWNQTNMPMALSDGLNTLSTATTTPTDTNIKTVNIL